MNHFGKLTALLIGCLIVAGCASRTPRPPPAPERVVPPEVKTAVRLARERSVARLKSYLVGVTPLDTFLADGWRYAMLTVPLGDVGITSYHTSLNATNWSVQSAGFEMGYFDFPDAHRVPVCSLGFGDNGKLESMLWGEVVTNRVSRPMKPPVK